MRTVTHHIPGLILTDHRFTVPLDYAYPAGEQITVFAREVVAPGKEDADLPWLVFFQGSPGFGGPRPDAASGWLSARSRSSASCCWAIAAQAAARR